MLSFKELMNEVAEPKAGDEQRFKAKHIVQVIDEPHMDKETREGTKKSPAKKKRLADLEKGEDEAVYEQHMMTCEDCGEEYDADEGEHECEMEEHFERIAGELLDEGINVDDLTEEQLDEIIGRIVRGAAKGVAGVAKKAFVNKQGNVRLSAAGRADSAERKAAKLEKKKQDRDRLKRAQERVAKARQNLANSYMPEEMSDAEMKKREDIVKGMKKSEKDLKNRYGDRWKAVMYATATKKAMEEVELGEALPPHLQKHFDKNGNKISGKWVGTGKDKKWVPDGKKGSYRPAKDVTPKGYGPNEEVELGEAFKVGPMKLKDGSTIKLTNEDVQALDNLYKNLNTSNRGKMQEKLEANKKSFGEILAFAKQAM